MVCQPELLVSKNNNNYYKYRRTLNRAQTRNILLKALSNQSRDRSGGGGAICVGRSTGCSTTLFVFQSIHLFLLTYPQVCLLKARDIFRSANDGNEYMLILITKYYHYFVIIFIILYFSE